MKTNEIAFCDMQKSAQEFENTGDSSETRCNVRRFKVPKVEDREVDTPPSR